MTPSPADASSAGMHGAYSYRSDPLVPAFPDDRPILLFDGYCAVCSWWARTVMRRDRTGAIRLLAASTPLGEALYRHYGEDPDKTYMVLEDGEAFTRSAATFRLVRRLGAPYSWVLIFHGLPQSLRDQVYDLVARNRYRLARRRTDCMLPTPEQAARFLG